MLKKLFIGVTFAVLSAGCAGPLTLEERFRQVAVYDEETGREWPILKRSKDIRLWVSGATEDDIRQINDILRQVTDATGLQVRSAPNPYSANVQVRFLNAERWRDFLKGQGYEKQCGGTFQNEDFGDPLAIIGIPDRLGGAPRASCIAEELAHAATGLSFDTNGRGDSVFGDFGGASRLMPVDYELLAILYDPRIKNGMTWNEARPIVQQIISEMEAAQ